MKKHPRAVIATALCALAITGCGVGEGADAGQVTLTVTRDYGGEELISADESISESDTVLRLLDRKADLETRYGGGFVQSIDGLAGGESGGRRSDWFFYVNGVESPVGAAEYELSGGDRVWWDYRDWTAAMRVPAVVGSWPEPFVHGFQGQRYETKIQCLAAKSICGRVSDELVASGAHIAGPAIGEAAGEGDIARVLIGPWNVIGSDTDAKLLAEGPAASGVFATLTGPGPAVLNLLNRRGEPAGSLGNGAGLVAAVRPDEDPPTWIVTGTDSGGVEAAAGLLGDPLRNHYAVAVDEAGPIGVPVP